MIGGGGADRAAAGPGSGRRPKPRRRKPGPRRRRRGAIPTSQGVWTSDACARHPDAAARRVRRHGGADRRGIRRQARSATSRRASAPRTPIGAFRNDGAWLKQVVQPDVARSSSRRTASCPPLTPEAAEARARRATAAASARARSTSHEDFTLYDRCITRGIVGSVLPVVYGNGNRILQTPDRW